MLPLVLWRPSCRRRAPRSTPPPHPPLCPWPGTHSPLRGHYLGWPAGGTKEQISDLAQCKHGSCKISNCKSTFSSKINLSQLFTRPADMKQYLNFDRRLLHTRSYKPFKYKNVYIKVNNRPVTNQWQRIQYKSMRRCWWPKTTRSRRWCEAVGH